MTDSPERRKIVDRAAGMINCRLRGVVRLRRRPAVRRAGDEGGEEALLHGIVGLQLGVPLHGKAPRVAGVLDRLDHAVLRPCDLAEIGSDLSDRLVVPGLHDEVRRSEDVCETTLGIDLGPVLDGAALWPPVRDGIVDRIGYVSVKITAARDVEYLQASTDAEERHVVAGEHRANEPQLERIALAAHGVDGVVRLAAILIGVDVATAGEDEAVHEVEVVGRIGVTGRQRDRCGSRTAHGVDIPAWDGETRGGAAAGVCGQSNDGPAYGVHGDGSTIIV
jgi:hypothetical protein